MSDKPIVYEQDGKVYYRASALGGCLISLAAARQGLEAKQLSPDAAINEVFAAGHQAEDNFVAAFPTAVTSRQMEVTLPVTSRIYVAGHLDGLHGDRLAEIKSQSDDEYAAWTPASWVNNPLWVKYSWQLSVYMLAMEREAALFRVRRSDVTDFQVHVIESPFHDIDAIRERVLEAESLAAGDTLTCTKSDYPCPYPYLHSEQVIMVDDPRLLAAIADYFAAKEEAGYQAAIQAEARKVFEEYFAVEQYPSDTKLKIVTPQGFTITRSEYDKDGYYVKPTHQVRITVNQPKKGMAADMPTTKEKQP